MRGVTENFTLDARVTAVLNNTAFLAELANGHEFTAFVGRENMQRVLDLDSGACVRVEMSPYDMSRGRILFEEKAKHEST
jgi:translation initiation factor IF-1